MKQMVLKAFVVVIMAMVLVGCGSYYKVTDPTSDKVYYTKDIDTKKDGAVVFKDEVSGSEVTLQNSEVMNIEKEEYKSKTEPPKTE